MPLYAYRCTQCGHKFEKIQNFSAEEEKECPKCHGVLERPLTAPGLNFKGAGWYVNDYAPKSSSPATDSKPKSEAESDKSAPAADAKTPSSAAESSSSAPAPAPNSTPSSTSSSTPSSGT